MINEIRGVVASSEQRLPELGDKADEVLGEADWVVAEVEALERQRRRMEKQPSIEPGELAELQQQVGTVDSQLRTVKSTIDELSIESQQLKAVLSTTESTLAVVEAHRFDSDRGKGPPDDAPGRGKGPPDDFPGRGKGPPDDPDEDDVSDEAGDLTHLKVRLGTVRAELGVRVEGRLAKADDRLASARARLQTLQQRSGVGEPMLVTGRVTSDQGRALEALRVEVVDKNGDVPLGEAVTDADGRYRLEYDLEPLRQRGKSQPDLQARVTTDAGDRALAVSDILFRAAAHAQLDVTIPPERVPRLPEYDRLMQSLVAELGDRSAVADLAEESDSED